MSGFLARAVGRIEPRFSATPRTAALLCAVALFMALLHVWQTWAFVLPSGQFKNIHLCLALVVGYLALANGDAGKGRTLSSGIALVLAAACFVPLLYIHLEYDALVTTRPFFPNGADLAVASLLLVLALVAVWREWGASIPIIAALAMLYAYWGNLVPGFANHAGIGLQRLVATTSIPYFRGLLGGLTEVSASTIFLFMLLAGLLKATGGLDYIMRAAFGLVGGLRAGPAQAAIVSSGFFGSISGSIMANVASTGAFTIPLMKRSGFSPHFAGAVEATASAGGQVTPPKLGLTAFLIVGITGISYAEVMVATVFPAILFYAFLMWGVHLRAIREGIDARAMRESARADIPMMDMSLPRATLLHAHLIFSVGVLVALLVGGMPAGMAALYANIAIVGSELVKRVAVGAAGLNGPRSPVRGLTDGLVVVARGLIYGARSGASVAIIIAVISIMVEFVVVTGFAQKLSYAMLEMSGGRLWLLLPLSALACLAFGIGLPTSAAYILVALLGAPAMVQLGVPLLAAHLFVFYYANMSAITPPVAVGALVASNIAGAGFWKTAFTALRLAIPGFLLPFLFVVQPGIIGIDVGIAEQLLLVAVAFVALVALNSAIEGHLLAPLSMIERVLLLPAAFGLLDPGRMTDVAGLALFAAILARQILIARRDRRLPTPEHSA
ncbi:TRAP transporter permease [Salinarimonas ramus]|uniref:C4-dicarboxylate ABC transporter n=1 Tax=Salinarimonas ramus TaxID=690164 RepID=A0A917QB15_9HYPH|nr:TRAP transporter fused permease subunit [Salinarimonas ramus]GGK40800.1 C4-dicarboxylate ABC transporter [Salinarimonas ramus]